VPSKLDRVTSARILLLPLIAALVLAAAGCGKSSKPETASEWASSFCSSVTTWKESVTSAVSPLKSGNISKDSVQTAFNDFKSATNTFVKSIKSLGKPPTQSGAQGKQDVESLSTQLSDGVNSIKGDVGNVSSVTSALAVVPSVTSTLQSMSTAVKQTYQSLQQLDPGSELSTAFQNSQSCKTLKTSANSSS
jgi:hypothetical protein